MAASGYGGAAAWSLPSCQPTLPLRPGQPARRSHDYTRHGTTSLFAALDIATGHIIGTCHPRRRAGEFRRFLDEIEAPGPRRAPGCRQRRHAKAPMARERLPRRSRWHVRFTPTGASWINQVERFFALLTDRQIRHGVHRGVAALGDAITSVIEHRNADPKPFR